MGLCSALAAACSASAVAQAGVRAVIGVVGGTAAQVLRSSSGLAGGVPVDLGAFRVGEPGRPAVLRCPVWLRPGVPQPREGERVEQDATALPAGRSPLPDP